MKIAVLCIGNRLMLDDGAGPAVYDALTERYRFDDEVQLYDAGCMTMDLLPQVCKADYIIVVDAVDGTGQEPGTVFRFTPDDVAEHGTMTSLHDMRLCDMINAAALLGHTVDGVGYGIQAENMSPAEFIEGLTPKVYEALPLLTDSVLAELVRQGAQIKNADGSIFVPPFEGSDSTRIQEQAEPVKETDFDVSASNTNE